MDVYSDPVPMSSVKCVMHGYLDTEKMDATFFTTNDFWFLIEYPFKLFFPMMDVYSDPMPMSSLKRVTHGYSDTEKMDFSLLMPHFSSRTNSDF